MQTFFRLITCASVLPLMISCSNNDNNNDKKNTSNCAPGQCCGPTCNKGGPGGGSSQKAHALTVDLSGALGLLITDPSQSGASLLLTEHNNTVKKLNLQGAPIFDLRNSGSFSLGDGVAAGAQGEKSLQKVTDAGEIKDIITDNVDPYANGNGPKRQELPKILTIAVSPKKDIYLHFERSFQYKDVPEGTQVDTWDNTKGYQCQIFKVKGGTVDELMATPPTADNLECIDNLHFIDQWRQQRNSVFQFDDEGNIYYSGSLPNAGGKAVVYKVSRDLATRSEIINANICVQDFLVTGKGNVFYTGSSCSTTGGGGGGNAGGYFRYVDTVSSALRTIATDWWSFIFEPINGTADSTGNQAIFFGPNPNSASTASWDSACLFKFDPTKTGTDSIDDVITCGGDIWGWLNMTRPEDKLTLAEGGFGRGYQDGNQSPLPEWKTEFARRCTSKGQVFAGGGSQISAIKQSKSEDKTYVIGNLRKKKEGSVSCNVSIKGPHCVVKNVPVLGTGYDTEATCIDDTNATHSGVTGTWVPGEGRCNLKLINNWRDGGTNTNQYNTWTREVTDKITQATCLAIDLKDTTLPENSNPGNITLSTQTPAVAGCTTDDGAGGYRNSKCAVGVEWNYDRQTDYNNVVSPLCTLPSTDVLEARRVSNIWDWSVRVYTSKGLTTENALENSVSNPITAATTPVSKFTTQWMNCAVTEGSGGNNNNWTDEYQSLARVNNSTKSLEMLSGTTERAIRMWIINNGTADVVYYSAYDSIAKSYRLFKSNSDNTTTLLADNMEIYNLSASGVNTKLYFDGIDFSNNTYQFGTIDLTSAGCGTATGCTRAATVGLTGTLKTIVILK